MNRLKKRREDKIRKCLFPAAGYGTRFLPATKATPKEMLPILTKPLIQYGVEEAIEAGMDTMAIVTGRGKRAIEDHFDISYELEQQIKSLEIILKSTKKLSDPLPMPTACLICRTLTMLPSWEAVRKWWTD